MLLLELIDTKSRPIKQRLNIDNIVKSLGPPIGEGYYATVYNGKRPNTVIKVAELDNSDDAYVQFIDIVKHHQNNPFFPRIYSAKMYHLPSKYQGGDADIYFVVEMEKLISLTNPKIVEALYYNIPQQIGIDNLSRSMDLGELSDTLLYGMDSEGRDKLRKTSQNPQFVEALDALEVLFSKPGIQVDTHAENWMVRLSGHGPQLVITDPVSGPW